MKINQCYLDAKIEACQMEMYYQLISIITLATCYTLKFLQLPFQLGWFNSASGNLTAPTCI